jgi:hypothetical protein
MAKMQGGGNKSSQNKIIKWIDQIIDTKKKLMMD